MKKLFGILILIGICLCSCRNDSCIEVPIVDNAKIKECIKNSTIEMFLSRPTNTRTSSLQLIDSEKQLLSQYSLQLLKSYGLSYNEIAADLGGATVDKMIDVAYSIIEIEEKAVQGYELVDMSDQRSLLTGELRPELTLTAQQHLIAPCRHWE